MVDDFLIQALLKNVVDLFEGQLKISLPDFSGKAGEEVVVLQVELLAQHAFEGLLEGDEELVQFL